MTRGGKRAGAGRPSGKGKYQESTKPIRIPLSKIEQVFAVINDESLDFCLPLYSSSVSAGFPSPAEDHMEAKLDLNKHLIKHPAATFFVKASGLSMINAGIHPGDILVVDRSLEPKNGKIVIAAINGELTVKRFVSDAKGKFLCPENEDFSRIELNASMDIVIWGVVTNVIHAV